MSYRETSAAPGQTEVGLHRRGSGPGDLSFPPHLLFGAATAAHQVEGGNTNNNWWRWERVTRPDGEPGILTGERVGQASDHWRRFTADLELMKALGLSIYRFSIEWSRVEPREGEFDEQAIARYRDWCERLVESGITPMVTLHHFSEPLWITERGGFENRGTIRSFARFVRRIVPELAPFVDHWVTVNEPMAYAVLGWLMGEFPPGKRSGRLTADVVENLLLAHAEAYHILHELDTLDADGDGIACMAGPASNIIIFEPRRSANPLDRALATLFDRNYNLAALDALETGELRLAVPGIFRKKVVHASLEGTWDYAGLNHYFRLLTSPRYFWHRGYPLGFDKRCEKNDLEWDLTPDHLYDALQLIAAYGKPIYVTENGTCDRAIPDLKRQRHLLGSLAAMQRAITDGVDVRAYLYWSLMDNFEWARGYSARFGLYRVDFDTQERVLTGGGELYREIVSAHTNRNV